MALVGSCFLAVLVELRIEARTRDKYRDVIPQIYAERSLRRCMARVLSSIRPDPSKTNGKTIAHNSGSPRSGADSEGVTW